MNVKELKEFGVEEFKVLNSVSPEINEVVAGRVETNGSASLRSWIMGSL